MDLTVTYAQVQVSSAEEMVRQIVRDYTKDYKGHSVQQIPFQIDNLNLI